MNVFDLSARIGLNSDDYDKGLSNAESAFSKVASGIKNGIGTIAKVTAAGMTAAAAGVAALSKQAVEGYADFEQLSGGVETLFKTASGAVMENANNAFRTAGLSANEYMETVTSFSASLISSLGGDTQKAAEYADKAIVDMSDNANKMGTSMESIQNAYQGFAKQNYTMLDNLKLGYGGTASEMQRLIQDAEKLDGSFKASRDANGDLAMSYADIVDAIHIVQENMDINGTTAKEAAETISGSIGMMKSSWQNLITGVANDQADFDSLIDNFITSVDAAANNIIPRVEVALQGVGKLVEKLVPTILERIPELISETLPALTESAGKMISTFGQALMDNADQLLLYAVNLIDEVWKAISESDVMTDGLSGFIDTLATRIPQILSGITMVALKIVEKLSEALQDNKSIGVIMEAVSNVLYDIAETIAVGIPAVTEAAFSLIKQIGQGLLDNAPWLLDETITLVEELAEYIAEAAPKMLPKIVELVGKLAKMITAPEPITRLVKAGVQIVKALADAIIKSLPALIEAAPEIVQNLVDAIVDSLPMLLDCAWELIKALTEAIFENIPALIDAGKKIIDSIGTGLMQALMSIDDICRQINDKINALMKEGIRFVLTAWKEWAQKFTLLFVSTLLGIATRINEFITVALGWGKLFIDSIRQGVSERWTAFKAVLSASLISIRDKFKDMADNIRNTLVDVVNNAKTWGKDLIQNFIDGIKQKWENLKKSVSEVAQTVKDFLGFSEPKEGPLSNFHTYAPDMMDLYSKGIRDNAGKLVTSLETSLEGVSGFFEPKNAQGVAGAATNIFNINISSDTIASDYDAYRAAQRISEELGNLQRMQALAVGA